MPAAVSTSAHSFAWLEVCAIRMGCISASSREIAGQAPRFALSILFGATARMTPGLLVLDFDGVVCDGMDEFFESSARALADVRGKPVARSAALQARFAALRPVVESGWEMVVLTGALADSDASDDARLRDSAGWAAARDAYVRSHRLERVRLTAALDDARDRWLTQDERAWLAAHRFFDGVAEWLQRLIAAGQLFYILSTKDKRFLERLVLSQRVPLRSDRIIGKAEPKREKWDVLRELAATHGLAMGDVWFVEDRLATLLEMRRHAPDLADARLFLAAWGYIFQDRDPEAARAAGIPVLSLAQATGPFEGWLG
jgi:phosphoglycolate phosphatase-like HAD superfamily hydrolase